MCGLVSVIEQRMSCKSCKRQFDNDNEVGMRPEGSKWRKSHRYIYISERYAVREI